MEESIKALKLDKKVEQYFLESRTNRFRNKYVLDLVKNIDRNVKILNVGDGTGTISKAFENKGFKKIIGVDLNKDFLKIAKKRCKYTKFKFDDAHNLSFKDNSFDIVTYVDVIEFLDAKRTIEECSRVVKKGGLVYIENFNSIIHNRISKMPIIGRMIKTSKSYKTNTNSYFIKLIRKNGFKILKFDYLIPTKETSVVQKMFYLLTRFMCFRRLFSPVSYFYLRKK